MPKIYGIAQTSSTSVTAGSGTSATYRYSVVTTVSEPDAGYISFNSLDYTIVSKLCVSRYDANGVDRQGLSLLRIGDAISVIHETDGKSVAFRLLNVPVDHTTWYEIDVETALDLNTAYTDHDKVTVTAIFSGASNFLELSDTPDAYTGKNNNIVSVNAGATGLDIRALTTSDIPNLDAAKITTGTIATARLGTGTASSSTYLRGDQTWQEIIGGVTVQASAPTTTTNAALGAMVYAESTKKLYVCVDSTPNLNVWSVFNSDFFTYLSRPYPGGTLTDGVGADTAPNKVIADADIFWALGTNFGTTNYSNPIDGVKIVQTNSSVYPNYGSPVVLADRLNGTTGSLTYASADQINSWFTLNFVNYKVNLSHIAIQTRSEYFGHFPRSLSVQYSLNGSIFTEAVAYTYTSNVLGGWFLIPITNWVQSQYLKIVQKSTDSSGYYHFVANELLLYGTLTAFFT